MNKNNWITGKATWPSGGDPLWVESSLAGTLLRNEFFGSGASASFPGFVKHYTSPTTYEMVQLQAWDGVAFVPALLKHWTGVEWKLTKGF